MYDGPVQDLIDELGRLPGVGPKSAQRIAFWLLEQPQADIERLATVLMTVKEHTRMCSVCFNVTDEQTCRICRDPRRDRSLICVVEESKDVVAIERTREFHGLYHVLGGSISPIDGRGPGDLRIADALCNQRRLREGCAVIDRQIPQRRQWCPADISRILGITVEYHNLHRISSLHMEAWQAARSAVFLFPNCTVVVNQ